MTTLPNMGLSLPLRGAVGSGQWDDTIDGDLSIIDPHDHTIGKGARVPTAGLNINADLPFSALYAPTQLHRVQFSAIAGGALTNANNLSLFVSDGSGGLAANELYYRTSAGNAIRFTSGSSLNVSAFVGGIGGDYASVVAQLNYDDAGKRYTLKEGTGDSNGWARLAAGALRLFEFNTTESVYVEQLAPAALAASYAMTWPTALPGAQAIAQITAAGQHVWSNTVPNAATFSAGVTVSASGATITGDSSVTGNLNVTGTLGSAAYTATGLITANAGLTAAANQHVTVSGIGAFKHGSRVKIISFAAFYLDTSPAGLANDRVASTNLFACVADFGLHAGDRITRVDVFIKDNATGTTQITASVKKLTTTTGSAATITSAGSVGNGTNQTLSMTGLTETVTAGTAYYVFATQSAANQVFYYSAEVTYDRP